MLDFHCWWASTPSLPSSNAAHLDCALLPQVHRASIYKRRASKYCCHAIWRHAGTTKLAAPPLLRYSKHHVQVQGALMSALTSMLTYLLCAGFFLLCGGYLLGAALHWQGFTALGFLYLLSWLKLLTSLVK